MAGFVMSAAIFSLPAVNMQVRVLFCIALATIVYPLVKVQPEVLKGLSSDIALLAMREVVLGLIIGFLTKIFFFAVSMTGDLVSVSLGLGQAQLFNPAMGVMGSPVEQFHVMLGSLFFLLINGHHMMITALVKSFEILAVGSFSLKTGPLAEVAVFGQDLLIITIRMSAPVLVSVLVANISMGILGRAIPQLNVLVTSFPVTVMLGLAVLILCLPLMVFEMNGVITITADKLFTVLKGL